MKKFKRQIRNMFRMRTSHIVEIKGGFGNQMFIFAFAESLRLKSGRNVFIRENFNHLSKRKGVLKEAFDITYPVTKLIWIPEHLAGNMLAEKIRRKGKRLYKEEKEMAYHPEVYGFKGTYYFGYFQTEKYFQEPEISKHIKGIYRPASYIKDLPEFIKWKNKIQSAVSVGVHIRGTDYLKPEFEGIYGGICTRDYYSNALKYMLEKHPDAFFYIFSDDKSYAESMIDIFPKDRCVMVATKLQDYEEFFLLSLCRHHIMANSSYSWWAAWLSHDDNSIDIAPDAWLADRDVKDIYTDWMIRLPSSADTL